jgi:hypothetical protein
MITENHSKFNTSHLYGLSAVPDEPEKKEPANSTQKQVQRDADNLKKSSEELKKLSELIEKSEKK